MAWVIGILVFIFACVLAAMALVAWSVFSGDVWCPAKLNTDWEKQPARTPLPQAQPALHRHKPKIESGTRSDRQQPRADRASGREGRQRKRGR
jgi:hypothetical protein